MYLTFIRQFALVWFAYKVHVLVIQLFTVVTPEIPLSFCYLRPLHTGTIVILQAELLLDNSVLKGGKLNQVCEVQYRRKHGRRANQFCLRVTYR